MDEFFCLGYIMSVDGDTDAAVTARSCRVWFWFRSLDSFLSAKDVFLVTVKKDL